MYMQPKAGMKKFAERVLLVEYSLLTERILDENGGVFGACFDGTCEVIHSYVETKEGLGLFCGSKYG
jgi:hypothetical protein